MTWRTPGEREPTGDARKVRRLASERGLASYMSDTRWRGVFSEFRHASDPAPRFRVFDLLAPPPHVSAWCRQWAHYPRPWISMQWLEVELPNEEAVRAVASLRERGMPAEATESGLRIWGWIGPEDRARLA